MCVGVMKDYKLKLRDLHDSLFHSYTLGSVGDYKDRSCFILL